MKRNNLSGWLDLIFLRLSEKEYDHGTTSGAIDLARTTAAVHIVTLGGNPTFTLSGWPSRGECALGLWLYAGGDNVVTMPAGVYWEGGAVPTLTSASWDFVLFEYREDAKVFGTARLDFAP